MSSPNNNRVILYASQLFADKTYGDRPYIKHLIDVASNVEKYWKECGLTEYEFEVAWTAAWLHDAIEDIPGVEFATIKDLFGWDVANTVEHVTDMPGRNRKQRQLNTYPRTARHQISRFLKLCDRLANTESGGQLNKMYAREHAYFKQVLYCEEFASIQNQIDKALEPELSKL